METTPRLSSRTPFRPKRESPADPSEQHPDLPCDDGLDDDGYELVDAADPECATSGDLSEWPAVPVSFEGSVSLGVGRAQVAALDVGVATV